MIYNIKLKNSLIKVLSKIKEPYYSNLKNAIYNLSKNPRPIGYKKLKNREAYRIRVSDYRVIYEVIDDILLINIIDLGHRKTIYKDKK